MHEQPTQLTHLCSAALVITAAAGSVMLICDDAAAQQRRFKVTPIRKIDFIPGEAHGTAGINDKGQIVYAYYAGGHHRAFVWLPNADYGLPAGMYDLALCTGFNDTIARDINMNGEAVGYAGTIGLNNGRAAVWSLPGGLTSCTALGTLPNSPFGAPNQPYSSAFAINDEAPPVIVGDSAVRDYCACNVFTLADVTRGFRTTYTGPGSALVELLAATKLESYARGVMTPADYIGGFRQCRNIAADQSEGAPCDLALPCQYGKDPVRWPNPTTPLEMARLIPNGPGLEVHDLNNKTNPGPELVGWGLIPGSGINCIRRGVYWATPASPAIDLGDPLNPSRASQAAAINNLTPAQIVGTNLFTGSAVLWEMVAGSWVELDLNCPQAIGNCLCTCAGSECGSQCGGSCPRHWILRQAHDINNSSWIVAYGTLVNTLSVNLPTDGGGNYLVLLTPDLRCPGDATADGCINMDDLLMVINAWGTNCGPGQFCTDADVTCDYVVNIDDLLAVNNAWCPGSCGGICCINCPPCSGDGPMATSGSSSGTGPLTPEQLVVVVLMSSLPAQVQAQIIQQILQY